jgi:hypothetical protein
VTGYSPEQLARLDELGARKREIDLRAATLRHEVQQAMREAGAPVREDYANRAAYRTAHSRWRKGQP